MASEAQLMELETKLNEKIKAGVNRLVALEAKFPAPMATAAQLKKLETKFEDKIAAEKERLGTLEAKLTNLEGTVDQLKPLLPLSLVTVLPELQGDVAAPASQT